MLSELSGIHCEFDLCFDKHSSSLRCDAIHTDWICIQTLSSVEYKCVEARKLIPCQNKMKR